MVQDLQVQTIDLTSTYGVWLICLLLETILYGCGLLQSWLYFHWYPNDSWKIKGMVIILVILETIQVVFFFASTYMCLITNFGNIEFLFKINWADTVQLVPTYLTAFVVQMYFAHTIYTLNTAKKVLPVLIVVLALTQFGAATAQDVVVSRIGSFKLLGQTTPIYAIQSSASLVCDLMITGALLIRLRKSKSNIKATNSMLEQLMFNAVNRGGLIVLAVAVNLVFFLALPGTFYFLFGLILSSKIYMNTAIATLNSRQHVRNRFTQGMMDDSWPLDIRDSHIGHGMAPTTSSPQVVEITVRSEVRVDIADTKPRAMSIKEIGIV